MDTLVLDSITKRYGGTVVLDAVTFTVRAGEIHALVGENGSGKSTLCGLLHGLPDVVDGEGYTGRVILDGAEVRIDSPFKALECGVALVHQEPSLIPQLSVADNVTLGREQLRATGPLAPVDRRAGAMVTERALAALGVQLDPKVRVGELGIGMRQLVEAARECDRTGVRVLILDEPSAALSSAESLALATLMRKIAESDVAVLFVSHRLSEVLSIADRVTVLRDGRVVGTYPTADVDAPTIARLMAGTDEVETIGRTSHRSDEAAVTIEDLRVAMPGDPLRGLTFSVRAGEIVGITSQAGHGRLSIASGLLGLYPCSGRVTTNGARVKIGDAASLERNGISIVHEDRREIALEQEESVESNIALPNLVAGRGFLKAQWFAGGGFPDAKAIRSEAERLVSRFDIKCRDVSQPVYQLSGGNQQKVAIARSVASSPSVLLAAEPTRGVDVRTKNMILSTLASIADEGVAVVVVSGETSELERLCDRIIVLRNGRVRAEFSAPYDSTDVELAVLGEALPVAAS